MKRALLVATVVLVLHAAVSVSVRPYSDLVITVGGWFVHGTDIADLPDMFLAGWIATAILWLAVTALSYWVADPWGRDGDNR